MKRGFVLLAICTALSILTFTGCGNQKTQQPDSPDDQNTKLSFWGWVPYNNVVEPMKEALGKKNPLLEVEVQVMDWGAYWDKLTLELANGGGPDVFVMNLDNYDKYKDYMEPLDALAANEAGENWKDLFLPSMLDSSYVEDALKVFPVDFGGQWYIYYNKNLMEELGQKVPATYEEFAEYAKSVEKDSIPVIFGGKEGLNCSYLYFWLANNREPGIVQKAAKGEADFTDAAFIDAFADLTKMMEDKVIPLNSFGVDPTTDQDNLFKGRKSPMVLTGAWQAGALLAGNGLEGSAIENDEIGVMLPPLPSTDNPYVVGALDHGWAINKNSPNKEAAMELLIEWTTGEAANIWLTQLYGIPCAKDVKTDDNALKSDEARKTIGVIGESLDKKLTGPRSTGNAVVDNKTGEVVQAYVQGIMDAEKAAAEMQMAYDSSK